MIKKIKFISLFICLLATPQLLGQDILANTSWKCNTSAFEDAEIEFYVLTKYEKSEDFYMNYGHSIDFGEGIFNTGYSAPCGNDCFTRTSGTYKFIDEFTIEIYVETINRSGFCSLKSETPKKSYGIYIITETETGLTISKKNN